MLSVVLTAVSSVMLKVSAIKIHTSKIREYFNPLVMGSYLMQGISVFLTIYAYKYVPLSIGQVLASSGQILVMILCVVFLHERIRMMKWIGLIFIFTGIFVATL
jgi:small multidrug resistance pump